MSFSLDYRLVGLVILFISDIYVLNICLSSRWHVTNEHNIFKKISLARRIKQSSLILFTAIGIHILLVPLIMLMSTRNYHAFKLMHSVGLVQFELFSAVGNNDLEAFKRLDFLSNEHLQKFEWFNSSLMLDYLIVKNKIEFIKSVLGSDASQWDSNYCNLIKKQEACGENVILNIAIKNNSTQFIHYLIKNNTYEISLINAESLLLKGAKSCNGLLVSELLVRGVNPRVPSVGKGKNIFNVMLNKADLNCKKIVSKFLQERV